MDEQERLELYERVHLREKSDLPEDEKIEKLKKKVRSKWIQLGLNVAIIIAIAYAYLSGYRPFADWLYLVFGIVFVINVVLLIIQRNQINELLVHLKKRSEPTRETNPDK